MIFAVHPGRTCGSAVVVVSRHQTRVCDRDRHGYDCVYRVSMAEMGGVTPDDTTFYRFPENLPVPLYTAPTLRPIYRTHTGPRWNGPLASQHGLPPMRPQWSVRPVPRPWAEGAAVERRAVQTRRPKRERRRRGRRAGRRHQQRRHRTDRDACRRPGPACTQAPRVLRCPERAPLGRTPESASEHRDGDPSD